MSRPTTGPALETADIEWDESGVPRSRMFDDVYFNRTNGLEETRYVFLERSRLRQRFGALNPGESFVIAETGFGTGLNFLATWQLWADSAPDRSILHFVSVERYPLYPEDLSRALDHWPELDALKAELIRAYPPAVSGLHRLVLAGGTVRLTLYFGDVQQAWQEMNFCADAWFLDGFAPSLNPEMWLDQTLLEVRRHSKAGATVATFTSVGRIRRGLAELGFAMDKLPGYGQKRDMLAGSLPRESGASGRNRSGTVTIVGAGIAGCLLARNLADRGVSVRLVDQSGPGSGASGNRQGALYVKLPVDYNHQAQLALSALLFSQRHYRTFAAGQWHQTGLLQLASNDSEADRQARFLRRNQYPTEILRAVTYNEASELAGMPVPSGGLWFPHSGWLEPGTLCEQLIDHPGIDTRFGQPVKALTRCDGHWELAIGDKTDLAETLVLCTGHLTPELLPEGDRYRFKAIRGQVSYLPEDRATLPEVVICGPRYLNPPNNGRSVTGATFDLHSQAPGLTAASHQENIQVLNEMLPGVRFQSEAQSLDGRVCFRCTTHDYQPVAGAVDTAATPGLYLFTGLGSKGLSYAPLLAEHLADCLCGQPEALAVSLAKRLNSKRCRYPA